jgi:hypothetical protein
MVICFRSDLPDLLQLDLQPGEQGSRSVMWKIKVGHCPQIDSGIQWLVGVC